MSQTKLEKLIWPIMFNAKQAKDGIGVYEAIAAQAHLINESKYVNFFALTQRFALESSVLGIAKIYDNTSSKHAKHTIYELVKYYGDRTEKTKPRSYDPESVEYLGMSVDDVRRLFTNTKDRAIISKKLYEHVSNLLPYKSSNKELKKIIEYRHKFVAHQEQLTMAQKRMYGKLPPIKLFVKFAELAEHICSFISGIYSNNVYSPFSIPCARMSTLNTLKSALNLSFDFKTDAGREAQRLFYKRLEG